MVKRRLLSGGAWALGGRIATAFLALATNALLARLLSPAELGAYFLAYSVVLLGTQFGALGLNRSVVRFVAEGVGTGRSGRARRAVWLTLGFGSLGAVGVGLILLVFGDVLGERVFHSPALAAVSGLMAGWAIVLIFQLLLSEIFRGFHDVRLATVFGGSLMGLGLVMGGLMFSGVLLMQVIQGGATLATVMLLAIGSGVASILLASWALKRKMSSLPAGHSGNAALPVGELLQVSWPLLVTEVLAFVSLQADLWIVGAFLPQEEVALYGAALRLVVLVGMAFMIVNAVLPSTIAEMYAQGRLNSLERTLRITATLAGIPAFLVLLGFILGGGPIMGFVFGEHYREAALILTLLSLGALTNVWTGCCGQAMMLTGFQRARMNITILTTFLTVAAMLLVVRGYGTTGVAATAAAGLAFQNVVMLLYAKKRIGIWTHLTLRAGGDSK